jgi:hypothetical protein
VIATAPNAAEIAQRVSAAMHERHWRCSSPIPRSRCSS